MVSPWLVPISIQRISGDVGAVGVVAYVNEQNGGRLDKIRVVREKINQRFALVGAGNRRRKGGDGTVLVLAPDDATGRPGFGPDLGEH